MALHLISKMSDGFTLIEIVLVVALFLLIASVSVLFATPTISQFVCNREVSTVRLALERAIHVAQFLQKGNVSLEVTDDAYRISAPGNSHNSSFFEEILRQPAVPVVLSTDLVFEENSGSLLFDRDEEAVEITIGGEDVGCFDQIQINHAGTIL